MEASSKGFAFVEVWLIEMGQSAARTFNTCMSACFMCSKWELTSMAQQSVERILVRWHDSFEKLARAGSPRQDPRGSKSLISSCVAV